MSDSNSGSPSTASDPAAQTATHANAVMPTSGVGWLGVGLTVAGIASLIAVMVMASTANDPSAVDNRMMIASIALLIGAGLISLLCVSLWKQRSVLNILAGTRTQTPPSRRRLVRYAFAAVVLWTAIACAVLAWSIARTEHEAIETARVAAREIIDVTVAYRQVTSDANFYALISDQLQSNPLLDVPFRDVTLPDGRDYTRVNPAYMTRLVSETLAERQGTRIRMTSLEPLAAANAPNDLERRALELFENGGQEWSELILVDAVEYVWVMRPLYIEDSCLSCHVSQGYQLGELRGGVAVAVPLAGFRAVQTRQHARVNWGISALWTLGVFGITIASKRVIRDSDATLASQNRIEEAYRALDEAHRDLEAVTKERTRFFSTISHELRTPLNSVIGFSEILLKGLAGPLNEEQTRQLTMVASSGHALLELVNEVLDLEKAGAGCISLTPSEIDIASLVEGTLASFAPVADAKSLLLSSRVADDCSTMVSDGQYVKRILMNLLANALNYTAVGSVTVEVSREGDEVVFSVSDTGPGIPPAEQEQIFEEFYRVSRPEQPTTSGTGLGLPLSRRFAVLLGGSLILESSTANGSEFVLRLPIAYAFDEAE